MCAAKSLRRTTAQGEVCFPAARVRSAFRDQPKPSNPAPVVIETVRNGRQNSYNAKRFRLARYASSNSLSAWCFLHLKSGVSLSLYVDGFDYDRGWIRTASVDFPRKRRTGPLMWEPSLFPVAVSTAPQGFARAHLMVLVRRNAKKGDGRLGGKAHRRMASNSRRFTRIVPIPDP